MNEQGPRHGCGKKRTATGLGCVLAGVCILLAAWTVGRPLWLKWKLWRYAGINVPLTARVLRENDRYTFAFMDGAYAVTYRASAEHLRELLSRPPAWAASGLRAGRNTNLARQLTLADHGALRSVTGAAGNTVFRILTVNTTHSEVSFELKEY